jgi:hypothetical protein
MTGLGKRWGNRPSSLWIADDFGVLRFRLMVKRGPDFRPQASEGEARAMKVARHRGMKKAIVALARRLAVIMHRMWVDGTEFRWTRDVAAA